jgi:hypothetical protein
MTDQAIMCNTPEAIALYRLLAMKGAIKMEARGMKMSRGVNVTAIARKELGLKPRTPHAEVIAAIEAKAAEMAPEASKGIHIG